MPLFFEEGLHFLVFQEIPKNDIPNLLIILEFNNCLINDTNSTLLTKMPRESLCHENDNDK